jgi:hypothetical protein
MKHSALLFWGIVSVEIVSVIILGYRYYRRVTVDVPKKVHVMPINKEYLQYPKDTNLKFYSEPKANIQKQEDLTYIGIPRTITHTFNADGLNERFDYPLEKEKGVFRIVSLGDSFTEGAWVATKDNYSELLEDLLNTKVHCPSIARFEVINLGVEGYDIQYDMERLKRKGLKYNPDLVILWTHENDYTEGNEHLNSLSLTFDPATQAAELVAYYKKQGDYYPVLSALVDRFHQEFTRQTLLDEELGYLKELIHITSSPVLIFTLERMPQDIQISIRSILRTEDRFFPEIPDSYGAFSDQHPSLEGHKQFATFLFQKLMTTFLPSCQEK